MSPENTQSPETDLGKSFERFMRRNTRPNPNDTEDNPLQRGAIWKGDQVYVIKGKQFITDSVVLAVKGNILEIEKGEQPNSFEAIFLKDGQQLANLEYISTTGETQFMDLADDSAIESGFATISIDVLHDFMSTFDGGTGDDLLEFEAIDFNGSYNTW